VIEAAGRHNTVFAFTADKTVRVRAAIEVLASDPATTWVPAGGRDQQGSEIAKCDFSFAGRQLRLIVRRQPTRKGDQLSTDDLDGWRLHAIIITNSDTRLRSGADVEAHQRLRNGGTQCVRTLLAPREGLRHTRLLAEFDDQRLAQKLGARPIAPQHNSLPKSRQRNTTDVIGHSFRR